MKPSARRDEELVAPRHGVQVGGPPPRWSTTMAKAQNPRSKSRRRSRPFLLVAQPARESVNQAPDAPGRRPRGAGPARLRGRLTPPGPASGSIGDAGGR